MATITTGYSDKDGKVRFLDAVLLTNLFVDNNLSKFSTTSTFSSKKILTVDDATGEVEINSGADFYTASNGITLSTKDFQLGGTLSSTTDINLGSSNLRFNLNGTGDFRIILTSTGDFEIKDATNDFVVVTQDGDVRISSTSHNTTGDFAFEMDRSADEIFINLPIKINGSTSPTVTIDNVLGTGVTQPIRTISGNTGYEMSDGEAGHTFILATDNTTAFTLPDPAQNDGRIIILKLSNSTQSSNISILCNSASTLSTVEDSTYNTGYDWKVVDKFITGTSASNEVATKASITLQADATADKWHVIGEFNEYTLN